MSTGIGNGLGNSSVANIVSGFVEKIVQETKQNKKESEDEQIAELITSFRDVNPELIEVEPGLWAKSFSLEAYGSLQKRIERKPDKVPEYEKAIARAIELSRLDQPVSAEVALRTGLESLARNLREQRSDIAGRLDSGLLDSIHAPPPLKKLLDLRQAIASLELAMKQLKVSQFDFSQSSFVDAPFLSLAKKEYKQVQKLCVKVLGQIYDEYHYDSFLPRVDNLLPQLVSEERAEALALRAHAILDKFDAEPDMDKALYASAMENIKESLRLKPDQMQARLRKRLIDSLMGAGRLDEALEQANQYVFSNPISSSAYIVRAQIHDHRGDVAGSILDLQHALQLALNDDARAFSLALLGRQQVKIDIEEARVSTLYGSVHSFEFDPLATGNSFFNRANKLRPGKAHMYYQRAQAMHQVLLEPEHALGFYGIVALDKLKAQELAYYKKAVELKPERYWNQFSYAVALAGQAKYDLALRHVDKALELAPDSLKALNLKAGLLASSGQPIKALDLYGILIDKVTEPKDLDFERFSLWKIHEEMAVLFLEKRWFEEAKTHLNLARQSLPEDLDNKKEVLSAYTSLAEYMNTLDTLSYDQTLSEEDVSTYVEALETLGQLDAAEALLRNFHRKKSELEINTLLAEFFKADNPLRAVAFYKKAIAFTVDKDAKAELYMSVSSAYGYTGGFKGSLELRSSAYAEAENLFTKPEDKMRALATSYLYYPQAMWLLKPKLEQRQAYAKAGIKILNRTIALGREYPGLLRTEFPIQSHYTVNNTEANLLWNRAKMNIILGRNQNALPDLKRALKLAEPHADRVFRFMVPDIQEDIDQITQ